MTQLKPVRILDNTKITSKISPLLNNVSHSFLLYLICFLFICKIFSFEVNSQQQDSDGTIAIPTMQWMDLRPKLTGSSPPGLKDFAIGYSKETNLVVIFGGTTPNGVKSGTTYLIDLNANTWATWKPPSDFGPGSQIPEARSNMIFGVDKYGSYRNALIISCGQGSGDVLYNDVWAFDFIYKQWTKVQNVSGEIPPPMYGSFGGIDTTLATSFQTVQTNTLWSSHGTDGKRFFTDLYALVTDGNLSPNLMSLSATWYKIPVVSGSEIPPGRSSVAGTILPNKRLAMYGGCDKIGEDCATPASYSLDLGSNYQNGQINTATPLWSKKNSCLGARSGATMIMSGITYPSQAIVYGGTGRNFVAPDGEVGVFDADLGNWVRVMPQKDPNSGYPAQRSGAQMIPVLGPAGMQVSDILLFGGEGSDGANINDIWILRLNNNSTTGYAAKAMTNPPMEFLKCILDTDEPGPPGNTRTSGTRNGKSTSDGSDGSDGNDFGKEIPPTSHVTFSTISFVCLPLASSVIRFGYGSNQKFVIAGLYTVLIAASYATAFYGFAIAYQDKPKTSGHFNTLHGSIGLAIIVLLYIFVPLVAIISLCISKKYEPYSISDDDSDDEKGKSKLTGLFNWRNSESNSKPTKSFEVSRPGNRLVSEGEQSPPVSMLKSSDNWMEQRKSVTVAENHPTMSSQGSRNNSLQNDPSSRRTSQSTAVSRSGLQASTNIITDHSSSIAIRVRHIHHIVAQLILIAAAVYIGESLITTKVADTVYIIMFIAFIGIIYLIWIIAAWYGHPKGRNSLLALFMHKIACGKGEGKKKKQYNFEENYGNDENSATPMSSSNRVRTVRIEDDEMDEEAEQAQLEQDMHNREVVVMTIPKRRLAVVNA